MGVEEVLLVESTGNRPDLLSIYGLAREVAALYDLPLEPWPGSDPGPVPDGRVEVEVEDFDGCPRYIGRVFEDISIGPSPVWLRAARRRLIACITWTAAMRTSSARWLAWAPASGD